MYKRRFLSFVLAAIIVFSSLPVISVSAIDINATRGYVVNEFVYAVGKNNLTQPKKDISTYDDYNKIDEQYTDAIEIALGNDLLKGYEDNTLRAEQEITRVEALVMLSRALKDLKQTTQMQDFTDTPDWAKNDVERLANAGVVLGYGDGTFGAEDAITEEQVSLLTDRIDNQFNKVRLQDDFYDSVNAKWFRNNTIPDGRISWSVFDEVQQNTEENFREIIETFTENENVYAKGSDEQKIADLYLSALNVDTRNKMGVKPINKYLNLIYAANTMDDLVQAMAIIAKETGSFSLLPFEIRADMKNSEKNMIYLTQCDTGISGMYFYDEKHWKEYEAYKQYLLKLFMLAGDSQSIAEAKVDNVTSMQKDLVQYGLSYKDYEDVNKVYNIYSIDQLQEVLGRVNIKAYFKTAGIENPENVTVEADDLFKRTCFYLNSNSCFKQMKDYVEAIFLNDFATYLTTDFRQAVRDFDQAFVKTNGNLSDEQLALNITCNGMGWQLGKMYINQCFSEDQKQSAKDMVNEIIAVYKKRIQNNVWMSDETKTYAIKKLDTMRIEIGYPEVWPTYMNDLEIQSIEEGGSLFSNISAIRANSFKNMIYKFNKPVDVEEWGMYPQSVNAYYSPSANEIVIPAGILQKPFYDERSSKEHNLGGAGFVIAHEITHAFDLNGSKYDERGNINNWWTKQDSDQFQALTRPFVRKYANIEVLPDKRIDGEFTLNENIADSGAMACILEVARERKNPDLQALFTNFAFVWAEMDNDSAKEYYLFHDNHSPAKYRVNVVLQNFQDFYDTYQIKDKDGMYVLLSKRIGIL